MFVLVLDDYHVIDAKPVDPALTFLLEHLPPQMHLVIATREDPPLPLARFRARGQLTELRAADLRFTPAEAAAFLNQVMGLRLSTDDIAALEARTEGWIAGLQLAALSMHGRSDTARFIQAFTGSHRFVLDYLVEEVLQQQPARVQHVLAAHIDPRPPVRPAVRCGSGRPCRLRAGDPPRHRARQFISRPAGRRAALVSLTTISLASSCGSASCRMQAWSGVMSPGFTRRASIWYEAQGLDLEALQHAAAAADPARLATWPSGRGSAWTAASNPSPGAAGCGSCLRQFYAHRPVLCIQYAWALMDVGEVEASEARLRDAERGWPRWATRPLCRMRRRSL